MLYTIPPLKVYITHMLWLNVRVVFSSGKDYKIFVRQFEYKYVIGAGNLFPERLMIIWKK